MKAKKAKAKKAIRKVTKKVAKRAKAKPRSVEPIHHDPAAAELHRSTIMAKVRELVEATAMNGGVTADNESKLAEIEAMVGGEPPVSNTQPLAAHNPALAA